MSPKDFSCLLLLRHNSLSAVGSHPSLFPPPLSGRIERGFVQCISIFPPSHGSRNTCEDSMHFSLSFFSHSAWNSRSCPFCACFHLTRARAFLRHFKHAVLFHLLLEKPTHCVLPMKRTRGLQAKHLHFASDVPQVFFTLNNGDIYY